MYCCWNFSLHFCPLLIGNFPLAYGGSTFKEVKKWILKMVDENGMKIFKCGLCGKVFKDSSNIRRHMITLHMEASHNPCPNCPAVFSDKYKLWSHLKYYKDGACKKNISENWILESDSQPTLTEDSRNIVLLLFYHIMPNVVLGLR